MTVDETIELLSLDSQLKPLLKFLSTGKGFTLEEFCASAKFQPPRLTHTSLLQLVRNHVSGSKIGAELTSSLWNRISKATGPILSSVISALDGTPAGRPADRKEQLKHYLIHHEFPVVVAKKKRAAKKAASAIDTEDLVAKYEALKERARKMSVEGVDVSIERLFNGKGCTVRVLKEVLKRQNLDTSGAKKSLLDRLRRVPRTLASGRALESFS